MGTFVYFVSFIAIIVVCVSEPSEKCKFEIDMETSKVKVSCAPGAVLHIQDQFGNVLLSGETSTKSEVPIVFHVNTSHMASVKDETSKSLNKLRDATSLLRKVRERLTIQVNNLNNLTTILQRGDAELKRDLDLLHREDITSALFREAIIAAIQNQYNFLRMGLLTQNAQMTEVISTSMTLATTILKTTRGALQLGGLSDVRFDYINETLANITRMMPGGFGSGTFFGEETVFCPQDLVSISNDGTLIVIGTEQGTFLVDPYTIDKIWVTYGSNDINQITQYDSLKKLKFEDVEKTYELPFFCSGTGHAIYKKNFYCQKKWTNKIVRYDLVESRWIEERQLDGVGVRNTYPYQSEKHSDIDFAVDEIGLWMIYATNESRGNIVISKMNGNSLAFAQTWFTTIPKRSVGNAFLICGVLYATDSYENIPTFIKYKYDTNTQTETILGRDELPFVNSIQRDYARVYTLDYSPSDRVLYSWNNGRLEIFPVAFSTRDEP